MDSNTNNKVSVVPPSGSTGSVSPTASPAASQAPQIAQNAPMPQQRKGKPMVWVTIFLLFVFVCGLAIAAWYFQTQLHKF